MSSSVALHGFILATSLVACTAQDDMLEAPLPDADPAALAGAAPSLAHPAVVLLSSLNNRGATCTGTVISPHVVLTAAHCVGTFRDGTAMLHRDNYVVHAAPLVDVDESQGVNVTRVMLNDNYRRDEDGRTNNDVAVAILRDPFPGEPLALVPHELDAAALQNRPVRMIGYGAGGAQIDFDTRRTKREGFAVALGATELTRYPHNLQLDTGRTVSCAGDSGGPLVIELDGVERVVAVNSFSDPFIGKTYCGTWGGAARVDVHLPWLHSIIDEVDPGFRANHRPKASPQRVANFRDFVRGFTPAVYQIENLAPGHTLQVVLDGVGPMDLFVQFGTRATNDSFACRSSQWGGDELCTVTVPQGAAPTAFISVSGVGTYTLQARWTDSGIGR